LRPENPKTWEQENVVNLKANLRETEKHKIKKSHKTRELKKLK
jgi:hypothetical protein